MTIRTPHLHAVSPAKRLFTAALLFALTWACAGEDPAGHRDDGSGGAGGGILPGISGTGAGRNPAEGGSPAGGPADGSAGAEGGDAGETSAGAGGDATGDAGGESGGGGAGARGAHDCDVRLGVGVVDSEGLEQTPDGGLGYPVDRERGVYIKATLERPAIVSFAVWTPEYTDIICSEEGTEFENVAYLGADVFIDSRFTGDSYELANSIESRQGWLSAQMALPEGTVSAMYYGNGSPECSEFPGTKPFYVTGFCIRYAR